MSLVNLPRKISPSDIPGQQAILKNQVVAILNIQTVSTMNAYKELFKLVYFNKQALTPQLVMDGLGTDAAQLLSIMSDMQSAVNAIIPGTLVTVPPVVLTPNPDGTVTAAAVVKTAESIK